MPEFHVLLKIQLCHGTLSSRTCVVLVLGYDVLTQCQFFQKLQLEQNSVTCEKVKALRSSLCRFLVTVEVKLYKKFPLHGNCEVR